MRRLVTLAAAVSAIAPVACVQIDGGSVEVPWAIFDHTGRAITDCSCTDPPLVTVEIDLTSEDDGSKPCAGRSDCRFPCSRKIGATQFTIPPGSYSVRLVPLDAAGNELTTFDVTTPVVQTVVRGQPTELGAYMFTAPCRDICQGGDTTQPCTSG